MFVRPGLKVARPVGAAGVPPQVQTVSPRPAEALPAAPKKQIAVVAVTRANTVDLMVISFFLEVELDGRAERSAGKAFGRVAVHGVAVGGAVAFDFQGRLVRAHDVAVSVVEKLLDLGT